jgi:hypothetical protein
MLLWTQPWIGTFNADEMRHMDYMRNLGDVGTDGGFACSCQPTESDCIFAEVSVGTVHNFYRRGRIKTGDISGGMTIYTQKRSAQLF